MLFCHLHKNTKFMAIINKGYCVLNRVVLLEFLQAQ